MFTVLQREFFIIPFGFIQDDLAERDTIQLLIACFGITHVNFKTGNHNYDQCLMTCSNTFHGLMKLLSKEHWMVSDTLPNSCKAILFYFYFMFLLVVRAREKESGEERKRVSISCLIYTSGPGIKLATQYVS